MSPQTRATLVRERFLPCPLSSSCPPGPIVDRHRRPQERLQAARRPPAYPNQARIIAPVTPSHPSAVLTPSTCMNRWIRGKTCIWARRDASRGIDGGWGSLVSAGSGESLGWWAWQPLLGQLEARAWGGAVGLSQTLGSPALDVLRLRRGVFMSKLLVGGSAEGARCPGLLW